MSSRHATAATAPTAPAAPAPLPRFRSLASASSRAAWASSSSRAWREQGVRCDALRVGCPRGLAKALKFRVSRSDWCSFLEQVNRQFSHF